jgi:hypothetical protein
MSFEFLEELQPVVVPNHVVVPNAVRNLLGKRILRFAQDDNFP